MSRRMTFKKETKHTVVYAVDDVDAAVESVYVSKAWLQRMGHPHPPKAIELTVEPVTQVTVAQGADAALAEFAGTKG